MINKRKITRSTMSVLSLIQVIVDLCAIVIGALLSDLLLLENDLSTHLTFILFVIISFLLVANIRNLYVSRYYIFIRKDIIALIKVWILSFCPVSFVMWLFGDQISLFFIVFWFFLSGGLFIAESFAVKYLGDNFFQNKEFRVAIVGRSSQGLKLARNLKAISWRKYSIVGFYDNNSKERQHSIKKKGDLTKLVEEAKLGLIDQIYIIDADAHQKDIVKAVKQLTDTTCSVLYIPNISDFDLLRSQVYVINNMPIISLYDTPFNGINSFVKRMEDIILSFIILILISPVLLTIACLIKATSKGPILFKQDRYGINGKIIKVWKFRSMKVMENDAQVKQATKHDPRLTAIGGFLRRTSLDELPQFFNVLLGSMSIVGPRPHAIVHNEQYRQVILGYMLRHKVKPGITGWAQINGFRGETETLDKMEMRVKYDLAYIHNWSITFDIKIILLTIIKGFISKTAY